MFEGGALKAIGWLLAAAFLGIVGFVVAAALVLGFELAALFLFGAITGSEIQPRGLGWVIAPLAGGLVGFKIGRGLIDSEIATTKGLSRRDRERARQVKLDEVREREKSNELAASAVARTFGRGNQLSTKQPSSTNSDGSVTNQLQNQAHSQIPIEDTLRYISGSWDEHLKLQLGPDKMDLRVQIPKFLNEFLPDLFERFPPLQNALPARLLLLLVTGICLVDTHPRGEVEEECKSYLGVRI